MKKIMFNDKYGLTQAVLVGQKTMTRRVLKGYTQKHLPYKVGEVIAIAQPYKDIIQCLPMYSDAILGVDGIPRKEFKAGWTNKMFVKASLMPHHIKNTDVKIERLQDISDEDIMREGIRKESYAGGCMYFYNNTYIRKRKANVEPIYNTTPMRAFASLIYKVCGGKVWRDNPLVVAYSFELVD